MSLWGGENLPVRWAEKSARVEWWVLWDREFKGVVWRVVARGIVEPAWGCGGWV